MRFRIRTSQGQELSFASEEMFADFVRSGAVSPDDLIYDGATGEWAPARTHTLIMELEADSFAESEEAAAEATEGGSESVTETETKTDDAGEGDLSFGLSLAKETTPDEASAAFVAEMEAERSTDFDQIDTIEGLRIDPTGSGIIEDLVPAPPEKPEKKEAPMSFSSRGDAGGSRSRPSLPEPRRPKPKRATPKQEPAKPGGKRSKAFGAIVVGIIGIGIGVGIAAVLFGPELMSRVQNQAEDDPPPVVDPQPEPEPEPEPSIPDTEEALRTRATERLLSTLRTELAVLRPIPDIWLDGAYLSSPSTYPDVREVWQEYLEVIRGIREQESELYTGAYLGALDDARVMTPATRTLRLAGAVAAFEEEVVHREGHYTRVDELVSAALVLHDLLTELEGSITYEPAQGPSLSADPVIQAVGRDEETQQQLNDALDRVLDALSADGLGPVDADVVPSWVFEGFREVITP